MINHSGSNPEVQSKSMFREPLIDPVIVTILEVSLPCVTNTMVVVNVKLW